MSDLTPETPTPGTEPEEVMVEETPQAEQAVVFQEPAPDPDPLPTGASHMATEAPAVDPTLGAAPGAVPPSSSGAPVGAIVAVVVLLGLGLAAVMTKGFGTFGPHGVGTPATPGGTQSAGTPSGTPAQPGTVTPGATTPGTPGTAPGTATPGTSTPGATPEAQPGDAVSPELLALLENVTKGETAAVSKALAANPSLAKQTDNRGVTPLHQAAAHGNLEIVNLLLKNGADPNAVDKSTGETTLHPAARSGEVAVVQALLRSKAKVNAKNEAFATPLHYAAEKGAVDVIEVLIKAGADVNAVDLRKQTPMAYANQHKDAAAALAKHGGRM